MQVTINENYTFSCMPVHRTCEFVYIGEEPPSVEYGPDPYSRDCVSLPAHSAGKETWPAAKIGIRGSFAGRGPTIDHRITLKLHTLRLLLYPVSPEQCLRCRGPTKKT